LDGISVVEGAEEATPFTSAGVVSECGSEAAAVVDAGGGVAEAVVGIGAATADGSDDVVAMSSGTKLHDTQFPVYLFYDGGVVRLSRLAFGGMGFAGLLGPFGFFNRRKEDVNKEKCPRIRCVGNGLYNC
jgi:hypothetical protein